MKLKYLLVLFFIFFICINNACKHQKRLYANFYLKNETHDSIILNIKFNDVNYDLKFDSSESCVMPLIKEIGANKLEIFDNNKSVFCDTFMLPNLPITNFYIVVDNDTSNAVCGIDNESEYTKKVLIKKDNKRYCVVVNSRKARIE